MARVERLVLIACGLALHAPFAHAQSAEAEVLFQEGRTLIKQGRLGPGCDKIAASQRLEPSVGTLLNLGDCREQLGQYATAWAAFKEAEGLAQRTDDDKREAEAHKRGVQLESKMSYLTVNVTARVAGLVIHRDKVVLDAPAFGTPLPVDAGRYQIVAEAPGFKPWRTTLDVGTGKRQVVVVPALERIPPDPEPRFVTAPPPTAPPPNLTLTEEKAARIEDRPPPATTIIVTRAAPTWSPTRKFAFGLGLAGAATVGAGVWLGFDSRDKAAEADRRCPTTICADPEALRLNDRAQRSATYANISYAVGGAALATSIVLWFVGAPHETVVTPSIGDHQVGVSLTGRL
jgi:hypothetical protein